MSLISIQNSIVAIVIFVSCTHAIVAQKPNDQDVVYDYLLNGKVVSGKCKVHKIAIGDNVHLECVLIKSGEFIMGAQETESTESESPVHKVLISKDFYIGRYHITQEQYLKIMGNNPSEFPGNSTLPVDSVSYFDAKKFCELISKSTGRQFSLPSEAQWEYACRAGTSSPFNFGSILNGDNANCKGSDLPYGTEHKGVFLAKTSPVGSYKANAWGLYDMHGNLFHWCNDWYDEKYYINSPKIDPQGPLKGEFRCVRGGAWDYYAKYCRSGFRGRLLPSKKYNNVGFRVVIN